MRSTQGVRCPAPSPRDGFTIVEVLLALLLLVTGLLALASTAAWTTEAVIAGSQSTLDAAAAGSELERLIGGACSAGQELEGPESLAEFVVVVETPRPAGMRTDSFVSARACLR